ncbi:MAG TPA: glycosyltransferase 87 family protein [Acidimicrobiia bacterium]|nr:glycosyltransferase 87 family protein [Acidimicrobiia bacterium]
MTSLALATTTVCTAVLLFFVEPLSDHQCALLVVVALAAWALLVVRGNREGLSVRPVVVAIAVVIGAGVVAPSEQSDDIFAYAMYGRIVVEHHDNPWNEPPARYPGDPMERHVARLWVDTADIYGPGFTALMVAAAPLVGTSTLLARLVYQTVAALAVALLLWLLWRRTRNPVVLAFVGLFPLTAASVVNGGHPDALLALALLGGVLLASNDRPVAAGFAFAAAVSINATMFAAAVVLAAWAWRRWKLADTARFLGIVAIVGALPYLFLGGWFDTARDHARLISRQATWNVVASVFTAGSPLSVADLSRDQMASVAANGATAIAAGLLVLVVLRHTRTNVAYSVAAAVAIFVVTTPWVMPWYGFIALPLFALSRLNLLAWAVALYAGCLFIGDQYPRLAASNIGTVLQQTLQIWGPAVAFIVVAATIAFGKTPPEGELPTGERALAASA